MCCHVCKINRLVKKCKANEHRVSEEAVVHMIAHIAAGADIAAVAVDSIGLAVVVNMVIVVEDTVVVVMTHCHMLVE